MKYLKWSIRTLGTATRSLCQRLGDSFYAIVAIFALLGLWASSQFVWNISNSAAPEGLYRITHQPLKRGALVLLRNPLKELVAGPGDTVTFSPEGVYVNGVLLPHSRKPDDSPYRPYQYGTQKLHLGQYLFMGDNPLSMDGRYEGPQTGTLIMAVVTPVFTKGALAPWIP
jgi:type IV secretory pathway protease TraF